MRIRQTANRIPNSSAIAEKIKSASTVGMDSGVPLYNPSPKKPPLDMANNYWVI